MTMQASVTIPPSGAPAAPAGHDEAMVARYEAGQAAAAAGVSQVPPATPPATPPAAPAAAPAAPAQAPAAPAAPQGGDFVDNLLTSAGLTREALAQEFLQGGLSDASYQKLAAKGVNKESVDSYMSGVKAQIDSQAQAYETAIITATVGSPEKYAEVVGWASTNLQPAEIAAFNDAVNSGDQARAAFAVAGLQARFATANPAEPQLLNQGVTNGGVAGYESWAQVKEDMKNPMYAKDPAFRDKVKARLALSPGIQ